MKNSTPKTLPVPIWNPETRSYSITAPTKSALEARVADAGLFSKRGKITEQSDGSYCYKVEASRKKRNPQ